MLFNLIIINTTKCINSLERTPGGRIFLINDLLIMKNLLILGLSVQSVSDGFVKLSCCIPLLTDVI